MQAYPEAHFKRTSDGEGLQLVAMMIGKEESMRLFADEVNEAIDKPKKIQFIETFSSRCRTAKGVFPGLLVSEAEKVAGRAKRIILSEIESRQYIEFYDQPPGIAFRIDYSGIFPAGSRTTTKYDEDAKILSLSIMSGH